MKITQSSQSNNTNKGSEEWFTGDVYIDSIRNADEQSPVNEAHVRFNPGARTAWHTHPLGQTLYVTDGLGLVSFRGGKPTEIRPGDSVYIEPGEEHWHGAAPNRFMTHIAVQESDEKGQQVAWFEHVSDEEYSVDTSAPE